MWAELEPCEAEEWVPTREVARLCGCRCLTRVDEAQAFGVLDEEDIDRGGFVAPVVAKVTSHSTFAALLPNATGREGRDPHVR